jgi:hypothetical protein
MQSRRECKRLAGEREKREKEAKTTTAHRKRNTADDDDEPSYEPRTRERHRE